VRADRDGNGSGRAITRAVSKDAAGRNLYPYPYPYPWDNKVAKFNNQNKL
jgi:hypothetical protein